MKNRLLKSEIKQMVDVIEDITKLSDDEITRRLRKNEHRLPRPSSELIDMIFSNKKTGREEFRCTVYDQLAINYLALAFEGNCSELFRQATLENKGEFDVRLHREAALNRQEIKRIFTELNAIGRNLNQVAKHCSTMQSIKQTANTLALSAHIQATYAQLLHIGMLLESLNPAYQTKFKSYEDDVEVDF
ncbi:hypothetical protein [Photobacterium sp. J15]|uniref:hypothetical protein n=1 Tax=Photobacterium sp. J15 TaxID=265901 RepID=UPI0007E4C261|nr:hypothetical protein [Photobacterium sp. J15]